MRSTILKFGLIAGALLSALMATSMAFKDVIGFEHGMTIGYTTMVLSFLLAYFGVRSYRDTVGGGTIGFWRAFGIAMAICGVATLCYVLAWEVIYRLYLPDYIEQYAAYTVERMRASGESAEAIATKSSEMAEMAVSYRNPLVRFAWTVIEPSPVAIVMSLLSAFLLRRRHARPAAVSPRLSTAES